MTPVITKAQVKPLIGKYVYALKKDGTVVHGKLVRVKGYELILAPKARKGARKNVQTKAFLAPLVLFDLLAIGTAPYAFGPGFGPGFGGYPYGGGFFW
ncbi:hypothetical protein ACFFK0_18865 [Paenibacillus chartarius]|uniref:50S ribosomal protein L33 n=1 Tax=Paenibacillus chartarius TaxID=747481 RepID=A0ABV6DPH0_9BACL